MKNLLNKIIRKAVYLYKRLNYQPKSSPDVRCYEAAAILAFRSLLSEKDKRIFDLSWEKEDEVQRWEKEDDAERMEGNDVFWTQNWEESCGEATLKSHPDNIRLFGTEGSGSIRVAVITFILNTKPDEKFFADVYYADGLGPTFYFNKRPDIFFPVDTVCMKVGDELSSVNLNALPAARGRLTLSDNNKGEHNS